ncbi:MAG TPA: ABATE domain-containing protein [Candidatus Binataceae bacterium]|nr:ABATE domain-containing protein [Candidatus Binataceae bacterium]
MADSEDSRNDQPLHLMSRPEMCLDFANTLAYRGSSRIESIHNFDELVRWCGDSGVTPSALAARLREWSGRHPKRTLEIFTAAISLRELVYRIFHALASGAPPDDDELDQLNDAMRETPARTLVARTDDGFGWEVENAKPSVHLILAPVLWSAADLLVGPQRARLRECSNDKCLWLFLDDSKNGTRRWCSMQACGNRAKAHRHYLRHKND